jgi:ferredoxin-NADP reductase/MOSC domain-containing protein YiiM/ferredoxin
MATLVSVNVGLPRDVEWNGRTVHTGVWKHPVDGPRMVRRLNIDGDGQGDLGGHGGEFRAVLVYQLHAYRHWADEFNRDDLTPGNFGENFTVDGLPDDEVCIGDRYRIGGAVFEVTQPRVTCYRVGLRLGQPRMPALLVAHHLPGFYLRVLTEGEVQAGDEITKLASGPEQVTVAEIDALLYLPSHSRANLQRALRIPLLSPGWKNSLRALADQQGTASGNVGLTEAAIAPAPAWAGFQPLTVTATRSESPNIESLWLTLPDNMTSSNWLAGQYITVRLPGLGDGTTLIRNYSLSNGPGSASLRISVKAEPHGAASGYLHANVHVGDQIDVAAPRGTFVLRDGADPVILASAGVGATPVLAMLHWLVVHQSDREVWWLHGARNGTEHAFAEEVRDLLNQLPHSNFQVLFSRPLRTDILGSDYTRAGRLSADALSGIGLPRDADAYLCGPAPFMADITAALVAYGVDSRRVHTETFGAVAAINPGIPGASVPPHPPPGAPGSGPQVSFARSGFSAAWDDRYASLLELAEACDLPTRWSCRSGVCHTCETALMSGTVRYDPDPLDPPATGNVLICCSRPAEAVALDL